MLQVKAATNQATINVTRSNDNPAVSILGMEHLAVMGKWLIPQQTKALLAKCVVKELPGSMTEAEMYAQRRAAATARSNKDKVSVAFCPVLPGACREHEVASVERHKPKKENKAGWR